MTLTHVMSYTALLRCSMMMTYKRPKHACSEGWQLQCVPARWSSSIAQHILPQG